MVNVDGYNQFGGAHWETGSVRNVLTHLEAAAPHTGHPFTEAMLLGLSGGITVMYFVFDYEDYAPHFALGTRWPFDAVDHIAQRLNLIIDESTTSSQKRAVDNLLSALATDLPAIVWADIFTLSYNALPASSFTGMQPIVVYDYDSNDEIVLIADRSQAPLRSTPSELASARAAQPSLEHRLLTLEPPEEGDYGDFPAAVRHAIQACIDLYTGKPPRGPKGNFGLAALEKWADLVTKSTKKGWRTIFAEPGHLYETLKATYTNIAHAGTGGQASRPMYADFLVEAATVLATPALADAAEQFRQAGEHWQALALSALPDDVAPFAETRELIARRDVLFREEGMAALPEMRDIAARLAALSGEMAAAFPLDEAGQKALLADLQAHLQTIHAVEAEAVSAMQDALA